MSAEAFTADSADVSDDAVLGAGTKVWHLAQVREHARLGRRCIVGRSAYIGTGVEMGDDCKVQNLALVYEPARLGRGVFIGPGDLSSDMGYLGQPGHPDVTAAIEDAIDRIKACGKAPGILTGDEALARRFIERGCLFTAVGSDVGLLARTSEQLAARFRNPA